MGSRFLLDPRRCRVALSCRERTVMMLQNNWRAFCLCLRFLSGSHVRALNAKDDHKSIRRTGTRIATKARAETTAHYKRTLDSGKDVEAKARATQHRFRLRFAKLRFFSISLLRHSL